MATSNKKFKVKIESGMTYEGIKPWYAAYIGETFIVREYSVTDYVLVDEDWCLKNLGRHMAYIEKRHTRVLISDAVEKFSPLVISEEKGKMIDKFNERVKKSAELTKKHNTKSNKETKTEFAGIFEQHSKLPPQPDECLQHPGNYIFDCPICTSNKQAQPTFANNSETKHKNEIIEEEVKKLHNFEKSLDGETSKERVDRAINGFLESTKSMKPPMGVTPRFIIEEKRFNDLRGAINRYAIDGFKIDLDWVDEYNELLDKIKKRG